MFQAAGILAEMEAETPGSSAKAKVGLRINPQVGGGSIASTSTATKSSKFGTGIGDYHDEILAMYKKHSFMKGLHLHVGSQGCPINLFVDSIKIVHGLALEINENCGGQQVSILDIGGGLPMNYRSDEESPTFEEYITEVCACVRVCVCVCELPTRHYLLLSACRAHSEPCVFSPLNR